MKRTKNLSIVYLIVIFLLLLFIAISSYLSFSKLEQYNNELINDTIPVIRTADDLWTQLLNQQAGLQGYLITQDRQYLDRKTSSQQQLDQDIKILDKFETDHPQMGFLIEEKASPQIKKIEAFFQNELSLINQGNLALAHEKMTDAKVEMDRFREVQSDIRKSLVTMTDRTARNSIRAAKIAKVIIIIGGISAFLIALLSSFLFFRAKRAEHRIEQLAFFDSLTGLPNRHSLNKYFKKQLSYKQKVAVLFLDLDRFKLINDSQGHSFGDRLLFEVASKFKTLLKDHHIFRYGGDEFIIILENIADKHEVVAIADSLISAFEAPFIIDKLNVFTSPSIGISLYPEDGKDGETLVQNADTAMYHVKAEGKNNYRFYTSLYHDEINRKVQLEEELRHAIDHDEFLLHYQPQIDLQTGKIIGAEALIRWSHPKLGLVSPAEFIPIAEETGLIIPIGTWVLETACRQVKEWQDAGLASFQVAVNVSAIQFSQPNFIDIVKETLQTTKLAPQSVELEITESVMQNSTKLNEILNELRTIGITLAVDDFGTGYSSLSYLKNLAIDRLKIDKSFVDNIDVKQNENMLKTIIDIGHNLNFAVIAEGIETAEQVQILQHHLCNIGQGYFFDKPLPAAELEAKLLQKQII